MVPGNGSGTVYPKLWGLERMGRMSESHGEDPTGAREAQSGIRDDRSGARDSDPATPAGHRDTGRRAATDRQDEAGATQSGRRDEQEDAPIDRQDDQGATPSGRRDSE